MHNRIWSLIWLIFTLLAGLLWLPRHAGAQQSGSKVFVLTMDGPLTPAFNQYLDRGLRIAERENAEAVILRLNTPGGSIDLMQDMVESIRASQVPVIVYVWPRGAIAGSAGTVITLAGHAAAMAPETAIGAASPVGGEGQDLGQTLEAKQKNILKATVRSLAAGRGQEAISLAESTIESAQAVSVQEAHQVGLVDFVAKDLQDLMKQLDGHTVTTSLGEVSLHTAAAETSLLDISFIEQLLATLTNPNIIFLLLTVGVQAILIEISAPGGWLAGFIGVVCLALATYGLGVLPVNWFGLVFLGTAFVLFILDIKAPTHGALTAAGVASLIVGALVLFNTPNVPSFQQVSVPLVVGVSVAMGGIFFIFMGFALRAQRSPVRVGHESLIGRTGIARSRLLPGKGGGSVQLGGELWSAELAEGDQEISPGERVEVVQVQGIRLFVRRAL
jgi:membrane-bound serine protease (ClpP class)